MAEREPDWIKYEEEHSKNVEFFRSHIENSTRAMFEYGVMIIKYLILLNGGALVALPAVAVMIGGEGKVLTISSATFYILGLVLAMICAYTSHLNWLFAASSFEELSNRRSKELTYTYLGEKYQSLTEVEQNREKGEPFWRSRQCTFYLTHLIGILSLACFSYGCFKLAAQV